MLGNLIIIPREVQKQDYQKKKKVVELCTDSKRCKIKNWKERPENRADWEKSIKEAKDGGRGGGRGREGEDAGQQDATTKLTCIIKQGYVHSLRPSVF